MCFERYNQLKIMYLCESQCPEWHAASKSPCQDHENTPQAVLRSWLALAALLLAPGPAPLGRPQRPIPAVQLPAYEVTAPKFTTPFAEFVEKMDSLFDSPWVDAQGGPLIQDIIWRHEYLAVHPSDEAIIYVTRTADGRVLNATTIYTKNGALYANSSALGSNVRLHGLTAADLHDGRKIQEAIDGIQEAYGLEASLETAEYRGLGDLNFIGWEGRGRPGHFVTTYQPVSGQFASGGRRLSRSPAYPGPVCLRRMGGRHGPGGSPGAQSLLSGVSRSGLERSLP